MTQNKEATMPYTYPDVLRAVKNERKRIDHSDVCCNFYFLSERNKKRQQSQ